jgi:hypothetical protein
VDIRYLYNGQQYTPTIHIEKGGKKPLLTVLSSKYIVLDKKSIPMVACNVHEQFSFSRSDYNYGIQRVKRGSEV